MIQNFEEIRKQLRELSEVINSYKSEAVQLRLVELIFGQAGPPRQAGPAPRHDGPPEADPSDQKRKPPRRKRRKPAAGETGAAGGNGAAEPAASGAKSSKVKSPKVGNRRGAVSTLGVLYDEGYFAKPRTLGEIAAHCDQNLALKFGTNEFSGTLTRYVRDKKLKRSKNADNQYEYVNAD